MQEVLKLLANSADQSAILDQLGDEGLAADGNEEDDGIVTHNGKTYNRVQIEGLGEETDYLMDEQTGDIYSKNFEYITNMKDNLVIDDDEEELV